MFTPEFVVPHRGEFVLVANHSLESDEAVRLSIEFVLARIAYGATQLPPEIRVCRVVYDIRGQRVVDAAISSIEKAVEALAQMEFRRL